MTMRFHYQTITAYRELPPRMRIVSDSQAEPSGPEHHLHEADQLLQDSQPAGADHGAYGAMEGLIANVFANQLLTHEVQGRQLAGLLADRQALTRRHLEDIDRQLYELRGRLPLRLKGPGAPYVPPVTEVEQQIFDHERQKRALEVAHWRDTQELRTELMQHRADLYVTKRRLSFLGFLPGGADA